MKVSELILKVEEFLAKHDVDLGMFYCITYYNDNHTMNLQGKYNSNLVQKLYGYGFSVSYTGYLEAVTSLYPYNEQMKPIDKDEEAYNDEHPLLLLNITLT